MGLDMYLHGKRYISKYFNEGDDKVAEHIQKLFPELSSMVGRFGDNSPVNEVKIDAAYWRKANAIHKWFVDNVQEGEDDCGNYYVAREQLQELRNLCQTVLDDKTQAGTLLPSQPGFFFGTTDYDEYYFADLENTIKQIDAALKLPKAWEFEYHSSW